MTLIQKELQNAYIGEYVPNFATQWPCPDGFHVPTNTDRQNILDVFQWYLNTYIIKLPLWWYRSYTDGELYSTWDQYRYWSSVEYEWWYVYALTASWIDYQYMLAWYWYNIRPFKDEPVVPDSSWTALYSNKVYHNSDLWLISLSSDWTTWITIADKNLWATTVWNNGDTLSESNCWKYYQRGNNYWFDWIWGSNPTTSWTQVNVQNYWPWNYYESSTFIKWNSWLPYTWTYSNLRWGEDWNVPVE